MRTSPFKPFFTKDLIIDSGEPINAFWGYHLANNYTRLMGLDGTVFFGARDLSAPNPQQIYFDVPIGQFSFHAAPVVQLYTCYVETFTWATVVCHGLDFGASLKGSMDTDDSMAAIHIPCPGGPSKESESFLQIARLGKEGNTWFGVKTDVSDEVLWVSDYSAGYDFEGYPDPFGFSNYYFWMNMNVQRGWGYSNSAQHARDAKILILPNNIDNVHPYQIVQSGTNLYPNSPLVEGILDAEKLRIRWLHDLPGTVYYKIFGA